MLATDEADIEERWGRFKEIYKGSAKKVLGVKRRVKNDWIIGETYRTIEQRRTLKRKIRCTRSARLKERAAAAYAVKDNEVKAHAREDKRRWLNDLAEEFALNNFSGDLYQLIRKIAGQGRNMTVIKDKEGNRLVYEARHVEHVEHVEHRHC